ncbi:hypothetical protein J7M07_06275, partial [bacterium]|nr:hypothetical protein [bacterium]
EINSGNTVYTYPGTITTTDSVKFELQPIPEYVLSSLSPLSASGGTEISVELGILNSDNEHSTLELYPSNTYISFADADEDSFKAYLSSTSQNMISGGESITLRFESSTVDTSIAAGSYMFLIHLEGIENGNDFETNLSSVADSIEIEVAPRLSITSIVSPQSVTASLQPAWLVRMIVHNTGEASVDMDLSDLNTYLTFNIPGSGDCTGEYTIVNPESLQRSGTTILAGNQVDTLLFRITSTGSSTGIAAINAYVTASDVNSGNIVTDDTFNGGGGYIFIQDPAVVAVTGTTISQDAITSGQTSVWKVDLLVENQGEADVTLSMDSTYIYSNYNLSVPTLPSGFSGGGIVLAGGESGHLVFSVTPSPLVTNTENLEIYSRVGVFEDNRLQFLSFDSGIENTGYGIIEIQTPAILSVLSLENAAPRSPFVNCEQYFPIVVQVENSGGAAADSIAVSLSGEGASFIEKPIHYLILLDEGEVAEDTFYVRASSSAATEDFSVVLESAVDTNSGQSNIVKFSEAVDSTATAEIQNHGILDITRVAPSQIYLTAGQTVDWFLTAVVRNSGEAPVTLNQPGSEDINFFKNLNQLTDYLVIAPSEFASGASGFTLMGGGIDSLEYQISSTGVDTGTVSVSMLLDWLDENNPDSAQTQASGDSAVIVREPAGLRIISVESDAPNNLLIPNTSIVNITQEFNITVRIENTGGDELDSIDVSLVTDGSSVISLSDSCPYLDTGTQGIFVFDVTASSNKGVEILSASITKAVSVSTGEEIYPIQAVESVENIQIQSAAELVCKVGIISPPGAVDDTLSTEQNFTVTASVSNRGEALVDNSGRITITLPDGFSSVYPVHEPLTRIFIPNENVAWTLLSPSAVATSDILRVGITTSPVDINIGAPAFCAEPLDSITILTEEKGVVRNCNLSVDSPPGAVDRLLSTNQNFSLRAAVTPSANSDGVWLELSLPSGYSVDGDLKRDVESGEGTETYVVWSLTAPPDEDLQKRQIQLTTGGVDVNSGIAFSGCNYSLEVETESAALINLSAAISGPQQALEGELSVNLPFTVEAEIENKGRAVIDTTGARLKIALPPGYSFINGDSSKAFRIGEPIIWNLKAPSTKSPPGNIRIYFAEPYANDSNTNKTAEIDTAEILIPVKTEAGTVAMNNISESDTIAIPPHVVPQGTRDVPMLKISFSNNSAYTVGLDTLYVTIRDVNGMDIENPSQFVDSVSFVTEDGRRYSSEADGINPIPIIVDHGFTINSTDSATASVEVDIALSVPIGGMRVELVRSNDIKFSIGGQSAPVSVVWRGGGSEIAGHFYNTPFTIMSGNFSEYAHNYPNPFRAGSENTRIAYFLVEDVNVNIKIYDYTGILVWSKDIAAGSEGATGSPGGEECIVLWDGRNGRGELVRNGIYICKITAGPNSAIFKIAIAK